MISRLLRVARSLRNYRPRQLIYWPIRHLQERRRGRVRAVPGTMGPHTDGLRTAVSDLGRIRPDPDHGRAAQVAAGVFHFQEHEEALFEPDWNRRYVSDLWTFHLHYFDYALDLAWAARESGDRRPVAALTRLVDSWLEQARPGRSPGWQAYPTAVRSLNWMRVLLILDDMLPAAARIRLEAGILSQLAVLERRLEFHRMGNHLQKNLEALGLAGIVFRGSAPTRWRRRWLPAFFALVTEHFLPDGVHYERSSMYHAHALADALLVIVACDAAGVPVPPAVRERLAAACDAHAVLSRPDGVLHAFNDGSAEAGVPADYVRRLMLAALGTLPRERTGVVSLATGGYHAWIDPQRGDRLVVDCGTPGAHDQPGHAHCDLLSFELDAGGRPVIVDSGTRGYGGDPLREYSRSTRAHNTVSVGHREQSEVWGTFRMGRMARPLGAAMAGHGAGVRFEGAYRSHDGGYGHARRIEGGGGTWRVEDTIDDGPGETLASFIHLHPDFARSAEVGWHFRSGDLHLTIDPFGVDGVEIVSGASAPAQGWYSPRFGLAVPAPVVVLRVDRNDGRPFGYTLTVKRSARS
jgi:uncharacterized heparinase superfamily protein